MDYIEAQTGFLNGNMLCIHHNEVLLKTLLIKTIFGSP